jgi:hypothetical protein
MLGLLVSILVACIVFGLLFWIISLIPLPPPFGQIIRVVLVVIFAIWIIYTLLGLAGGGLGLGHPWPR